MSRTKKRKNIIACLAVMCIVIVPAIIVFAEGDFLSAGSPQVTAGQGYSFRINLESFKGEYEEASKPYTLTVNVSPSPASISVSPDVNVHQFGSKLTFSSTDLASINTLTVTVYPGSELIQEQAYDISVNVAGDLSTPGGNLSFVATPKQEGQDQDQPGGQDEEEKKPNKKSGKKANKTSGFSGGVSVSVDSSLVYAGHWDNYLDALAVDGYEFTNEFNKTRDTYFINVPEGVESVSVSTTASDSSAKVRIVGEDNISEDYSKIMINVTADNGEVRTYRIYVTHKTEEQ